MDVLVLWQDGTKNVVYSSELKNNEKNKKIRVGSQVKMLYRNQWYRGTVLDMELEKSVQSDSSDDIPLVKLVNKNNAMESDSSEDIPLKQLRDRDQKPKIGPEKDDCKNELEKNLHLIEAPIESSYRTDQYLSEQCEKEVQINVLGDELNTDEHVACNITESLNINKNKAKQWQDPSTKIKSHKEGTTLDQEENDFNIDSYLGDISDHEDPTYVQTCEAPYCKREVFSSCHLCLKLLCYEHFIEYGNSCETHSKPKKKKKQIARDKEIDMGKHRPEHFVQEGEGRENESPVKKPKVNKSVLAKKLRAFGETYISQKTGKSMPARNIQQRCNGENCKKQGRQCLLINDEQRLAIFQAFKELGDLTRQREFIVRHVKITETIQKTSKKEQSRRQKSNKYYLTTDNKPYLICKNFFLKTLGISERIMRTALEKVKSDGMVEGERRGGRQSTLVIERDKTIRSTISNHIKRFPTIESHYCRSSSSREYLHSDLTVSKMYDMLLEELGPKDEKPSIALYRSVFRSLNLSFHRAKKDQCSLCTSYREGDEASKTILKDKYEKHCAEKNKVRDIKKCIKEEALTNRDIACASFDLQQVIYLPRSKENALFYKRRLANYNFTFYDIVSKKCQCFIWNEISSKRGAAEISTCVFKALQNYDSAKYVKSVAMFCDGCSGQNKNSVVATMLLYTIANTSNIEDISLFFFESFHGQNEGDSAHSAVSTALVNAGDLFIPSQLYPVVRLARRKQPYIVHPLQPNDFLNFKKLAKELRILTIRTSETGEPIKWHDFMELKVKKSEPLTLFYKTSHLQENYKSFKLKRQTISLTDVQIEVLNNEEQKISKEKYADLKSLCQGETPVIRLAEYKNFYLNIPHE